MCVRVVRRLAVIQRLCDDNDRVHAREHAQLIGIVTVPFAFRGVTIAAVLVNHVIDRAFRFAHVVGHARPRIPDDRFLAERRARNERHGEQEQANRQALKGRTPGNR